MPKNAFHKNEISVFKTLSSERDFKFASLYFKFTSINVRAHITSPNPFIYRQRYRRLLNSELLLYIYLQTVIIKEGNRQSFQQ